MSERSLTNDQIARTLGKIEQQIKGAEEALRGPKNRESLRVKAATENPYEWVTKHAKTYNEHWFEESRKSPYEHFPEKKYLCSVLRIMEAPERVVWWEKSRDMMLSWACVAYFTFHAMKTPFRGVLFQTQKLDKAIQLLDYAKTLYRTQDEWLRDSFPLEKPLEQQANNELRFANGSSIIGIPGGADQIRSYHPWGYFNDESSFQPEAGECFNEALSVVKGKIVFSSSAGPGWYADARRDIVRSEEN